MSGREEADVMSGTEAFTTQACEENPYGSPGVKVPPKAGCKYPTQPNTTDPAQSTPVVDEEGPQRKRFRSSKREDEKKYSFMLDEPT